MYACDIIPSPWQVADDLLRDIRDVYNAGTFLPYCLRVGARNEYGVHVVSEESQALEALQSRVTFVPQVAALRALDCD